MILQKELAKELGVKKRFISYILTGKRKINGQHALELYQRTGIDVKTLIRGGDVLKNALEDIYGPINMGRGRVKR